ncbi:MAG: carbohydrate ABC transporter permease [Chloroflexi bacterium]|nr:carbohydrate ABC transporter permease [Chloroflexota bacterium]
MTTWTLSLGQQRIRLRITPMRVVLYLVLIAGAFVAMFPFIWMILTSFKSYGEVTAGRFFPRELRWQNYVEAWNAAPFGRYFLNSLFIAMATIAGDLFSGILAAYAFARMEFPGRNVIFFLFLATLMIPGELTVLPNFLTIRRLGWYNTYQAQIIPFTASVFHIFLLRQFFMGIPREYWDAALLDGCSHFRYLWSIVVPLSRPAVVTVALLSFIGSWNAFLWPLIVTSSENMRPIQVGLRSFVVEEATQTQLMMAAATMVIVPIIIFYLFTQKYFTEGLTMTGLKG